jgi:hypothetical protein
MKPLKIVQDHPKKDPDLGVESENATLCSLKGMRKFVRTSSLENSLIARLKGVQTLWSQGRIRNRVDTKSTLCSKSSGSGNRLTVQQTGPDRFPVRHVKSNSFSFIRDREHSIRTRDSHNDDVRSSSINSYSRFKSITAYFKERAL